MGKVLSSLAFGILLLGLFAFPQNAQASDTDILWGSHGPTPAVTIFEGETVTWIGDFTTHPVVSGTLGTPDGLFDSGLTSDSTFSHTFFTAGTFDYYDGIHTGITGSIQVLPKPDFQINEILTDPASTVLDGDANCDGVIDANDDEFIEFFNTGLSSIDLTNHELLVDGVSQHTFVSGPVVNTGDIVLVFGGGTPTFSGSTSSAPWCIDLPSNVHIITTTGLSLPDASGLITLQDGSGNLIIDAAYGPGANFDQSVVKFPELEFSPPFINHTAATSDPEESLTLMSPGTSATGNFFPNIVLSGYIKDLSGNPLDGTFVILNATLLNQSWLVSVNQTGPNPSNFVVTLIDPDDSSITHEFGPLGVVETKEHIPGFFESIGYLESGPAPVVLLHHAGSSYYSEFYDDVGPFGSEDFGRGAPVEVDFTETTVLNVSPGNVLTNLNATLALNPPVTINGTITDVSGNPLEKQVVFFDAHVFDQFWLVEPLDDPFSENPDAFWLRLTDPDDASIQIIEKPVGFTRSDPISGNYTIKEHVSPDGIQLMALFPSSTHYVELYDDKGHFLSSDFSSGPVQVDFTTFDPISVTPGSFVDDIDAVLLLDPAVTPPTLDIVSPLDGSAFNVGESVLFESGSYSFSGHDISRFVNWTSSIDGLINYGNFSTTFSTGTHIITANVTDTSTFLKTLDSVTIIIGSGNTPPTVNIELPLDGTIFNSGALIKFNSTALDAEDGIINNIVNWTSSIDGNLSIGNFTSDALSTGTHVITANATDSGSVSDFDSVSITVLAPGNTPPTVNIELPLDGTIFNSGALIKFNSTALDAEDGIINNIVNWTSSIDGNLSIGNFTSDALSTGTHVITANATDSGSVSDFDSVSITINSVGGTLYCGQPESFYDHIIDGTSASDSLGGTIDNDLIRGFGGNDQIQGFAGNDCILGGDGNDTISGGDGNDTIEGGLGIDHINGRDGDDNIFGGDGLDILSGGAGNDTISGGLGNDNITGRAGIDTLSGNDGNDIISGGTENDTIFGNDGDDQLSGRDGDDTIDGGVGTNICSGDAGTNTITNCVGYP